MLKNGQYSMELQHGYIKITGQDGLVGYLAPNCSIGEEKVKIAFNSNFQINPHLIVDFLEILNYEGQLPRVFRQDIEATKDLMEGREFEVSLEYMGTEGKITMPEEKKNDPAFASALAKSLAGQREQSSSQLVRELASVRGTGFGLSASPQEVESETLASLDVALSAIAAKAPEEAEAYRQLVLGVAETVAEAKGGVKPGETAALDKIRDALGAA